jgi:hypothetical protein
MSEEEQPTTEEEEEKSSEETYRRLESNRCFGTRGSIDYVRTVETATIDDIRPKDRPVYSRTITDATIDDIRPKDRPVYSRTITAATIDDIPPQARTFFSRTDATIDDIPPKDRPVYSRTITAATIDDIRPQARTFFSRTDATIDDIPPKDRPVYSRTITAATIDDIPPKDRYIPLDVHSDDLFASDVANEEWPSDCPRYSPADLARSNPPKESPVEIEIDGSDLLAMFGDVLEIVPSSIVENTRPSQPALGERRDINIKTRRMLVSQKSDSYAEESDGSTHSMENPIWQQDTLGSASDTGLFESDASFDRDYPDLDKVTTSSPTPTQKEVRTSGRTTFKSSPDEYRFDKVGKFREPDDDYPGSNLVCRRLSRGEEMILKFPDFFWPKPVTAPLKETSYEPQHEAVKIPAEPTHFEFDHTNETQPPIDGEARKEYSGSDVEIIETISADSSTVKLEDDSELPPPPVKPSIGEAAYVSEDEGSALQLMPTPKRGLSSTFSPLDFGRTPNVLRRQLMTKRQTREWKDTAAWLMCNNFTDFELDSLLSMEDLTQDEALIIDLRRQLAQQHKSVNISVHTFFGLTPEIRLRYLTVRLRKDDGLIDFLEQLMLIGDNLPEVYMQPIREKAIELSQRKSDIIN